LYEAAADPLLDLQREDIADFNRIAWTKVPAATLERFRAFDNIPLKSSGLVFVTPDKELRRMIYNCLDIKDFRQAVSPQDHSFNDISTILPVGVPGGSPGVPEQVCAADSALRSGKTVTLAAVDRNNREMLLRAADRFYKKTGIKIIVRMYDAGDLVKTLFKRPHPYDMITIRYSVVQPEYETFFKDFSVRNGFLDYDLPEVSSLRKRLLEAEEDQEKSVLVAKINDELRDEAVVLPLYQEVRTFYYPKKIRNLAIGKGFTEYPEVADFRW
jgi:MarR-like DNA-binding transcriptional regulator SgrR of sgrS sRNA